MVERYKEKNAGVGKAVSEALSSMHKHCWALPEVVETLSGDMTDDLTPWSPPDMTRPGLTGALGHTNPKVKEDLLNWLKEEVSSSPKAGKAILPKLAPAILPQAAKCAEDAVPSIREAAVGFLSGFAARVSHIISFPVSLSLSLMT